MKLKIKIIILSIIVLSISCSCNCFAGSNVEHIFDLAKKSVCKDVATDILKNPLFTPDGRPTGKTGYFISELRQLTATPFPYRFEITNGYQEGFVYYALLGYLSEMDGKIPFAYRCYQNTLAYIDEDKSFDHREPRHEIELGIGRIYLQCGRYYDAYNIFDTIRLESRDKNILIAADEGLIKRAIAIGDYKEACEMYEDLGTMTTLTRDQFNSYAKVLFSLNRDRNAFAQLLYGIAKYGFDENLGVKDPMIDLFLNALPRATDDEIEWYYDLVGYGIMDARAQKGDEKHLLMLLKTRMLFSTVFSFLKPEDDIKRLEERIIYLKTNMTYQSAIRYSKKADSSNFNNSKVIKSKNNIKKILKERISDVEKIDELLMEAEVLLYRNKLKKSRKLYKTINNLCTNEEINEIIYDDSTIGKISKIGLVFTEAIIDFKNNNLVSQGTIKEADKIIYDGSKKMAILYVCLSLMCNQELPYTQECVNMLPVKNEISLQWLEHEILEAINKKKYELASDLTSQYFIKSGHLTPDIYHKMIFVYVILDKCEKAFNTAMMGLLYFSPFRLSNEFHYKGSYWYRQLCRSIYSWASDEDIITFNRLQLISELPEFLINFDSQTSSMKLHGALFWQTKYGDPELELRNAYNNMNYVLTLDIITNSFVKSDQAGHIYKEAICWYKLGNFTNAFYKMMESIRARKNFVLQYTPRIKYSSIETNILKECAIDEKTTKIFLSFLNENNLDNKNK